MSKTTFHIRIKHLTYGLIAILGLSCLNWWLYVTEINTQAPKENTRSETPSLEDGTGSKLHFKHRPITYYKEITNRPLFRQNRKPIQKRPPKPKQPEVVKEKREPVQQQPQVVMNLKLLGILLEKNQQLALLSSPTKPKGTWKKIGDAMDGWTVKSITAEHVTLENTQKKQQLKLYEANITQ